MHPDSSGKNQGLLLAAKNLRLPFAERRKAAVGMAPVNQRGSGKRAVGRYVRGGAVRVAETGRRISELYSGVGRSVNVADKQEATVYFEGRPIDLTVERNNRARRVRLKVGRASRRVVLVLPRLVSLKRGVEFAQSKAGWIVGQLAALPEKRIFQDGMSLSFLGRESVVHHSPAAKRGVWYDQNVIWVSGKEEHLARRVRDFLKKEFAAYALHKARETANKIKARVQKVTIRDTTSRWGSCSRTGHLSLSWRLALAPLFVADYVIAHEVAHLIQMNHSVAFWRLVADLSPDYKKAEQWLKKNAAYLYSFSAEI